MEVQKSCQFLRIHAKAVPTTLIDWLNRPQFLLAQNVKERTLKNSSPALLWMAAMEEGTFQVGPEAVDHPATRGTPAPAQ